MHDAVFFLFGCFCASSVVLSVTARAVSCGRDLTPHDISAPYSSMYGSVLTRHLGFLAFQLLSLFLSLCPSVSLSRVQQSTLSISTELHMGKGRTEVARMDI